MIAAGRRVLVMPQLKREQGIEAARTIFGKCHVDSEKCADGIQALRCYRYEADEAHPDPSGKPGLRKEPLHNWASHAADAFRTAAVMIREPKKKRAGEAATSRKHARVGPKTSSYSSTPLRIQSAS